MSLFDSIYGAVVRAKEHSARNVETLQAQRLKGPVIKRWQPGCGVAQAKNAICDPARRNS